MRLGLFTVLFPELDLEELLDLEEKLGLDAMELSSKAGRGLRHFHPEEIVGSERACARFLEALDRKHITISQLNCACNPVSPAPGAVENGPERRSQQDRHREAQQGALPIGQEQLPVLDRQGPHQGERVLHDSAGLPVVH